jgi:S-adenosylmethionine synthetase
MMFGYAEEGNEHFMPLPIIIAHELVRMATLKRKTGEFENSLPDMKSQVTINYNNDKPQIDTIVMSVQHTKDAKKSNFNNYLKESIIDNVLKKFDVFEKDYRLFINPTGRFVIGGPHGDTGLTGRKIIVDTYGGYARHGGGAFSGKDATKVDKSGAYMARYLAKNIVAAGLASQCEIQIAYAIGVETPVSLFIETYDTEIIELNKIREVILDSVDLTPKGIIDYFELKKPIYKATSAYGHFGRLDIELPWEKLDLIEKLKNCNKKEGI